ncbi:MAG TPA: YajQ family cyclic di-GMP-binding protein [Vicinamibacterales bacterium]|nr:YajQ family cyclic di-GMP-binding protein [Vicinamibacterales bacterium]
MQLTTLPYPTTTVRSPCFDVLANFVCASRLAQQLIGAADIIRVCFMANLASFDITSGVDLQEVDNAVNQARKEVAQRYDFKGSKASIDFNRADNNISLTADDDFKMTALWEILQSRLVRRGVPTKNLTPGELERAANDTVRRVIALQQGIPTEAAKDIVKFLKDHKLKRVQAAIQSDQVRVSSPSKDDLQEAMRLLREHDFGVALQFGNYRG